MKLNNSAKYIQHCYKQTSLKREQVIKDFINTTGIKVKLAFGNIYIQIEDIFTEKENDFSVHNRNYGGVSLLGNINGKTEYLLYYKDINIMKAFHSLRDRLQNNFEESQEVIKTIEFQHGKPNVQHCLLVN